MCIWINRLAYKVLIRPFWIKFQRSTPRPSAVIVFRCRVSHFSHFCFRLSFTFSCRPILPLEVGIIGQARGAATACSSSWQDCGSRAAGPGPQLDSQEWSEIPDRFVPIQHMLYYIYNGARVLRASVSVTALARTQTQTATSSEPGCVLRASQ